MPATPKSLRAAPPRRFENYILTRVVSRNTTLTNVPDASFVPASPGSNGLIANSPGEGYALNSTSSAFPIGFDFQLDGITYNKFVACTNGWLALVDPHSGSFSASEVMTGSIDFNPGIRSTFTSNAVLIAPWFDLQRNVSDTTEKLFNAGAINATQKLRTDYGLQVPPPTLDSVRFGVRYFRDRHSPKGRRLIVRWDTLSPLTANDISTRIQYESIIYENGTIEFRYANKQRVSLGSTVSAVEGATIGVFMPGGADRFRDFSYGLGYRDNERQMYRYGGSVVNSAYTDSSAKYTTNLKTQLHWPAGDFGAAYIFQPPVNRRRVLPRLQQRHNDSRLSLPTVARTGDTRLGNDPSTFDDRRTLNFTTSTSGSFASGVLVNYPTTLQRFYGDSEASVTSRQNLFAGDFEFTGSTVKSAVDEFLVSDDPSSIEAFNESKRYENDPAAAADPFFISGSSINQLGMSLQQPLKSKTQIRMAFPVSYNVAMPGVTSSIYYYNRRTMSWNVPKNASYFVLSGASSPPGGTTDGDWANASMDSPFARVIEDTRGFGPIGNSVVSGTSPKAGVGDQSYLMAGAPFNPSNVSDALAFIYNKSAGNNGNYKAIKDETFTLPITAPFLVEKAVIEVPMAMGDGWFKDKTTCLQPLETTTGSFDFAGPGITLALYNQVANTIGGTRRDLVMSSTITHTFDNVSELVLSSFGAIDSTYQLRPRGFLAFGSVGSSNVITPVSSSTRGYLFTGSIATHADTAASNGVSVRVTHLMNGVSASINRQGVLDLFNTKDLILVNKQSRNLIQTCSIAYVDNFGRGGGGFFDISGRATFGGEFGTSQLLGQRGRVPNPFYLPGAPAAVETLLAGNTGSLSVQFANAIVSGTTFTAHCLIPLKEFVQSPYVIFPTDNLVLAAAKTRPIFLGTKSGIVTPGTSGSLSHDVQFLTGTIYVTLYGSQLQQLTEYHDTLNQPLSSDAIHEIVIGGDPVLDQYEVEYREIYLRSYTDMYVTGSMVTKSVVGGVTTLATGARGLEFSKINARNVSVPSFTANQENITNPSKAYRNEPNWQRAGSGKLVKTLDLTERYYDSMMPSLNDAFAADGCAILVASPDVFGSSSKVDQRMGWMIFDLMMPGLLGSLLVGINGNWTKSFPFEPRYSRASRQLAIKKEFTVGSIYSSSVSVTAPQEVPGFFFGPWGGPNTVSLWTADANISGLNSHGFFTTSSAGNDDMARALFGFGDLNNCLITVDGDDSVRIGTNHYAEHRNVAADIRGGFFEVENDFGFSPLIRGWKYGVISGIALHSDAYFRRDRFGQFRDMLEQRLYTKYYRIADPTLPAYRTGITPAAVQVKFVDSSGKLTKPENTWSQNLSTEATSSMPFFDGETRNRPDINVNTLNANIIAFTSNQFGQVTL